MFIYRYNLRAHGPRTIPHNRREPSGTETTDQNNTNITKNQGSQPTVGQRRETAETGRYNTEL